MVLARGWRSYFEELKIYEREVTEREEEDHAVKSAEPQSGQVRFRSQLCTIRIGKWPYWAGGVRASGKDVD